MQRPTMVVKAGLTDEERTMAGLFPVARIARPRRVLRKNVRKRITAVTAIRAITVLYALPRGPVRRSSFIIEKTVTVLFIFRREAPPITAMLME